MRIRTFFAAAIVGMLASTAMAQPSNTINAGLNPTSYSNVSAVGPSVIQWWSFTLTQAMTASQYMVIDNWTNTYTGGTFGVGDSELGLYDGVGNRLGSWDDFGTLARRERIVIGNSTAAGGDGYSGWGTPTLAALGAGIYYVGVGPYNCTWNATGWSATVAPAGTVVGDPGIQIFSNIPSPGALALMGIAGLIGGRRRRN